MNIQLIPQHVLHLVILGTVTTGLYLEDYIHSGLIALYAVGGFLNYLVTRINGGTMPVFTKDESLRDFIRLYSHLYHEGTKETKLRFLSDAIDLKYIGNFSVGDIFVYTGIAASLIYIIIFF